MHLFAPTLAMAAVLTTASLAVFGVAILAPEVAPAMGLDPKVIGVFTSVVYLFGALSGSVTSAFLTRFGGIRTCQFSMLFAAAGMFVLTLGSRPAGLLSAVFLGCAYGPFNPASAHVLMHLTSPRWRPFVFSLKQTGVPLGGVVAGAAVPLIVVLHGWQAAAGAIGIVALTVALAIQPLRAAVDGARDPRFPLRHVSIAAPLRLIVGDPALLRYTITAVAFAGCQLSVGAFMVVFLTEAVSLSLVQAGLVFVWLQAGGFTGRILWGAVAGRRVSPRAVLVACGVLMAIGVALFSRIQAGWPMSAMVLVSVLLGASSFAWNGVALSEIATRAPPGRAADATAGMQFVMFGGIVVFPVAFALVVAVTGSYAVAFQSLALLALLGVAAVASVRDTGQDRHSAG